jgi:hypothetical protein
MLLPLADRPVKVGNLKYPVPRHYAAASKLKYSYYIKLGDLKSPFLDDRDYGSL